ncbi:hypothetical protein [Lutibacter sp.]
MESLGFLPTHNPTLKKPKEMFFANARKNVYCKRKNRPKINGNISEIGNKKTPE